MSAMDVAPSAPKLAAVKAPAPSRERQPYPYKVAYTDKKRLKASGYEDYAYVPFILDGRPGIHRLASSYLIDKAFGVWTSYMRSEQFAPALPPEDTSLDTFAHWLIVFLEWCDVRGVDLKTCDYLKHVHGRFQQELRSGSWSRDGVPLSPKTTNLYVDIACDFLTWGSVKGHRDEFKIPMYTHTRRSSSGTDSQAHHAREYSQRKGKARVPKKRLRMPTDASLDKWLESVYRRHGLTCGLICELILMTGLRRREAVCWRVDTLPAEEDWHITNPEAPEAEQEVLVHIKYGTKGRTVAKEDEKTVEGGDKIGPGRDIKIPLHFAKRLDAYRSNVRPSLLSRWVGSVRGAKAQEKRLKLAAHLFRDEKTGQRFQYWKLYDAWTNGVELPYKNWHPHLGRDHWACSVLLQHVKAHDLIALHGNRSPGDVLAAVASDIIRLFIQPQLGHARIETCFIYLQWVADQLSVALPERYQAYLDNLGDKLEREDALQ